MRLARAKRQIGKCKALIGLPHIIYRKKVDALRNSDKEIVGRTSLAGWLISKSTISADTGPKCSNNWTRRVSSVQ